MIDYKDGDGLAIRKAKDNGLKLILGEHELFVEFLRDFIGMDIFKDVSPADVVDMSERFLPLFQENRDSDTVKRVNLKGTPLFVITIVEHESQVNFRSSFKMLQYIMLVLEHYEKEEEKKKKGKTFAQDFKYPPVLPVVFYDGKGTWTAETNFLYKTELHEVFEKYIPKFEYELVNLNDYSQEDLVRFGDTLSLLMLIDKIKTADGIRSLENLPPDYVEKLALNIPEHLNKLMADVITVLLTKINIPKNEVEIISEKIYRRRYEEMFAQLEYDILEKQRLAAAEGKLEGKLEATVNIIRELSLPLSSAISVTKLPESGREQLIRELKRLNVVYTE